LPIPSCTLQQCTASPTAAAKSAAGEAGTLRIAWDGTSHPFSLFTHCVNTGCVSNAGFYISPAFLDKITIHIAKNFMDLPKIKVPLILGIWGGKGQVRHVLCG
jgi:hypothetical protein